jgi:hypothetical protein
VRPSCPWPHGPDFRVFAKPRLPGSLLHNPATPLMGFDSPSEFAREASGRHISMTEATLDGASLEVSAPTAFPRAAAAASSVSGLPRPRRLTPSGFLNLLTLHSCRACRTYFRPDPLLGFSLQSFAPRPQPYTVSGASALMSLNLRQLRHKPHPRKRQHGHKKQRSENEDPRLQGLAPRESPPPAKAV